MGMRIGCIQPGPRKVGPTIRIEAEILALVLVLLQPDRSYEMNPIFVLS